MKEFDDLLDKVTSLKNDAERTSVGNKAAGVRLRKGMQEVKALAQSVREGVIINLPQSKPVWHIHPVYKMLHCGSTTGIYTTNEKDVNCPACRDKINGGKK